MATARFASDANIAGADNRTEAASIIEFAVSATEAAAELVDLGRGYWLRRDGQIIDVGHTLEAPRSFTGRPMFSRPASFAAYLSRHRTPATSLWVDAKTGAHIAVLDGQEDRAASWEEHVATLTLELTEPWRRWLDRSGQWLTQAAFVELLEVAALGSPAEVLEPGAAELAGLVANLTATVSSTVRTVDVGDGGKRQVAYEESAKIRGKANVDLPTSLKVRLSPFEGVDYAADLTARLAVTAEPGSAPMFCYRLLRVEQALAGAVATVTVEVLAENGDLEPYFGAPS